MAKIFCSKCGTQIEDTASFCFRCGNQINTANTHNAPTTETKKKIGNPFTKFIFISLSLQILCLALSGNNGILGAVVFGSFLALTVVILVFSILTISKSKKYNKRGRAVGIVFAVLSSLLIAIVVCALLFAPPNNSVNSSEKQYINNCVNTAATNSIGQLKSSLKDPSSLKINRIYAKVYDTRITAKFSDGTYYDGGEFKGYFEIYIDYTANNSLGGANREYYYYKYNQDLIRTNSSEIDSMPVASNDVWVLDVDKYNELAENMLITP